MRNPDRIPRILALIRDVWQTKYPDMRFFQFMEFLQWGVFGGRTFYTEDDEVIEVLQYMLSKEETNENH